jgi:hypothetical protein
MDRPGAFLGKPVTAREGSAINSRVTDRISIEDNTNGRFAFPPGAGDHRPEILCRIGALPPASKLVTLSSINGRHG